MSATLKAVTISGISWSGLSQIATQACTFVISVIVARILGPKTYGLIGMITVFTGFANLIGDLGLSSAIIQRKELTAKHLDTAFWMNIGMGLTMTLVIAALSPVVALFYHEPQLTRLTVVLSLRFLIGSLSVVPVALLTRAIRFKTLGKIQLLSTVVSGMAGMALAFAGGGAWSLVAQSLCSGLLLTTVSWCLSDWRPSPSFTRAAFKDLFSMSSFVVGFNLVNYWERSFDQLLVGRMIGASGLGLYARAYSLMLMPLTQVSGVIGKVMFPALSTIQDDHERVKRAFLRIVGSIALVTFPMMTGMFAVAEHFILAILGPAWAGVIPVFRIFCWVGLIQSIGTTTGWIYLSQGKTRLYFLVGGVTATLCMVAFLVGIHWGVEGVAWSYLVFTILEMYPVWRVTGSIIGLGVSEVVAAVGPTFLCSLVMGVCVKAVDLVIPSDNHWLLLSIEIAVGVAVYVTLAAGLRLKAWTDSYQAFCEALGGRMRAARPASATVGAL